MKSLKEYCKSINAFLESNSFGSLVVKPEIVASDVDYLKNNFRDSYHQAGGAIMSMNGDSGVVDSNCKVHGTSNLYIAGAAVFPSSSYANPTFTALALANRLGSHLHQIKYKSEHE